MDKILVRGGKPLKGTVTVDGAKNAVLPILAATLLASKGKSVITNVPLLSDVYLMNKVLDYVGAEVEFDEEHKTITVDSSREIQTEAPFEFVSQMRASVVVMGPLLSRFHHAKVAMPGGCAIGSRPVDLHLKGFEALGASVSVEYGSIEAKGEKLTGTSIYLDFPSVGATENIMMAAVLAEGRTFIENVAKEPEIVDLANFLNRMGAKIQGAGTDVIRIDGVEALHGTEHAVIPDRIEAGTFMVAAAITQGDIHIVDAVSEHNVSLISKLKEMGVTIEEEGNSLHVIGPKSLKPTNAKTLPYPGFPTDMQAIFTIAQLAANGISTMKETVFENRFMHLEEIRRMNVDFVVSGDTATLYGGTPLSGANVFATDLRAAAALILAGLIAKGTTAISRLVYLDRGYYQIEEKLKVLGADIERVEEPDIEMKVN